MHNMGMLKMDKEFKQQDENEHLQGTLKKEGVWRIHIDPGSITTDYNTFDKHLAVTTSPKKTAIITTCRKRKNKVKNTGLHRGQTVAIKDKT